MMLLFLFFLGSYLIGTIPFGVVLTRLAGKGDLRRIGSGNIGATNVLRTGNRALALATLLLDGGKGAGAVGLASLLLPDAVPYGLYAAGLGAFLGHIYSVFLKFEGGKGVATFLGLLLALHWPLGLACCATWLGIMLLFRMSSLSALVATALAPLYSLLIFHNHLLALFCMLLGLMIFLRHKDNIKRLLSGTEPKVGT